MTIINVLVMTIFISCSVSDNFIQAEITGDAKIERLDVSKEFDRYYRLLITNGQNQTTCSTRHTDQQSRGEYAMKATLMYSPDGDIQFQDYTNMIINTAGVGHLGFIVEYQNNHPLYIQIYKMNTPIQMRSSTKGQVYIIGRRKVFPDGLIDELKESNISEQGLGRYFDIYFVDISNCSD